MRLIFVSFSKCSKFHAKSKDAIKISENVFSFEDNCIVTGSGKLSALVREYMYLAVNVLTSSPKISDMTKNDFF